MSKFYQWLSANSIGKYSPEMIVKALEEGSDYCCSHGLCKMSFWEISEAGKFTSIATRLLGMRIFRNGHKSTALVLDRAVLLYKEYLKQFGDDEERRTIDRLNSIGIVLTKNEKTEKKDSEVEHMFSKDDDEETIRRKLDLVTTELKGRYQNKPATSLKEVLNDNKDIPVGYINAWARKLKGQTALQYLIACSIIKTPTEGIISEEEKRKDRKRRLEEYTQILTDRYANNPASSLKDMINQNPGVSFTYINSWAREFYGLTSSEYLCEKGLLFVLPEKTVEEKLRDAIRQIKSSLGENKAHSLSDIDACLVVTTMTLRNWVKTIHNKNLTTYLVEEGILEEEREIYGCQNSNNSMPAYYESNYKKIYEKLYSISKVYDDPLGITIEKILFLLGDAEEYVVRKILDQVSWAVKLANDRYSFCKNSLPDTISEDITQEKFDIEKYQKVLLCRYRNGMLFDSIDFENFRETYCSLFDEDIPIDDDELERRLYCCGVIYKNRLFPAEGIIDNDSKEKLYLYIDNSFASGKTVLYYKAIFEDLADTFENCFTLSDEDMLRAYIEYTAEKKKYYFTDNYMSVERNVVIDHNAEVEELLLNSGKPMATEAVCGVLTHIPQEQIIRIITTDNRFLRNAKGEYFHAGIFEISDSELNQIQTIINSLISDNGYAIWTDVWNAVQEKMPVFLENNLYLSGLGVRNALAQKYVGTFNFEGAVISSPEDRFAMRDVYQLYAKHHDQFSADDIYNLSKDLDTVIYFDALAEVSVRVNHELFVSKRLLNFDIDEIDRAIGSFISKDYIKIRDIDSYLVFPNVGYEWNEYLLESFVNSYSKQFMLLNNGFALHNVAGAIVKRNSQIREFVDVCAEVLADEHVPLKKSEALNYLAEVNLITQRRYKDLEIAMVKATQIIGRRG